ncbi:MAG: nicotinamide riboside transporter PnuC [Gammaproteobacteria bacterium]|nr:nicotinamide riboside transporter PnuC [Gammaproteobacteria bacterium]NNM14939.1 nicotinamide mononucleotide transporter [Gammaproteobacteria bacterium]
MTLQSLLDYFISLEGLASVLAIVYLMLAIKQNVWCWVAGIASTAIFMYVVFNASLYMEAGLQVFYIVISFYGIWQWKYGGKDEKNNPDELKVSRWPLKNHIVAVATIVALALVSTYLLEKYTDAALPFIDSLTTWGGIVTTYMVAKKIFENWHYWFVIDSISIYLFYSRELYIFAGLFAIYLVLIVFGFREWKRSMQTQAADVNV